MSKKKQCLIRGADVGTLREGERATLYTYSGEIIQTSPIQHCFYSGKFVYVETEHTVYQTQC